jgi:hypothetical protein
MKNNEIKLLCVSQMNGMNISLSTFDVHESDALSSISCQVLIPHFIGNVIGRFCHWILW